MFDNERLTDGCSNCYGCGTYKTLKAFYLPANRNPLVLCYKCQKELEETLRRKQ